VPESFGVRGLRLDEDQQAGAVTDSSTRMRRRLLRCRDAAVSGGNLDVR
jgi:hypothetical protein